MRTTNLPTLALLAASLAGASCSGSQSAGPMSNVVPATPVQVENRPAAPPQAEARPRTPDAPFRAQAPAPGTTPPFTPPRIDEFRLANGMRVLLAERHDLPIVVAQYVTRRGASEGPPAATGRPGLASFVGALLESGTTRRTSLQLSDDLAAIGAEHGTWMGWDGGGAMVKVLASNVDPALEILADIVQHPRFDNEEIARLRQRRLATIQQELDSPRNIAGNVAARVVFDQHPYARTLLGTTESVTAITRAEIVQFYTSHFAAADGALVIVGDATRAVLEPRLNALFGRWRPRAPNPIAAAAPSPVRGSPRIFVVDRGRVAQSNVVVAQVGVPRATPDYPAIVVMNTILGGMFSSRINMNLREAHAYTYGASSGFSFRHLAGPFSVGGAITTQHTAPAIREIFNELDRMRTSDVTDAELSAAQARLTDSLPARFEGVDQVAAAVAEIFYYNLPLDEYATYASRIRAITAADVRRVAQQYLDPDNARVVVVGSRADVEQGLRDLNMGDVEVRDALGARPGAATPGGTTAPRATSPAANSGATRPSAGGTAAPSPTSPTARPRPGVPGGTTAPRPTAPGAVREPNGPNPNAATGRP